jgi:uncharacterized protein YutE (UPF0331/DUF86 family)
MNAAFNGVIQRKLALLDTQVAQLERHMNVVTRERFAGDWVLRSMAERALQVAAEIVIDVAERIIALRGGGPVATARDAIERLVEWGVLPSAEPYAGIVQFRDLIVHHYEEIDPGLLFDLVTTRLGDFRAFRNAIDRLAK